MNYRHSHPGRRIAAWLQALMALIYLGTGLFLLLSDSAMHVLPGHLLPWVATALVLYGLFRGYRAWNNFKSIRIRQV